MRFNIADAHLTALLLAGRVRDAVAVAEDVHRQAADLPGEAQLPGAAVAGRAALGEGQLESACRQWWEHAALGLSAAGHGMGWGFRYKVVLVTALAMHGDTDEAVARLAELDDARRPFRSLDYERSLARAWVAASQGAVSEAIAVCLSAAERASDNGQFGAEVFCLQTATQFGDRTGASRLAELASDCVWPAGRAWYPAPPPPEGWRWQRIILGIRRFRRDGRSGRRSRRCGTCRPGTIAVATSAVRPLGVRPGRRRSRRGAVGWSLRRCARPPNRCR